MTNTPTNFFCQKCEYNLRGLTGNNCPECGTEFDRNDPKTYLNKPRTLWQRIPLTIRKIAIDIILAFVAGVLITFPGIYVIEAFINGFDLSSLHFDLVPMGITLSIGTFALIPIAISAIIIRCFGRKWLAGVVYWVFAGVWLAYFLCIGLGD